jgi:hypothetical protein
MSEGEQSGGVVSVLLGKRMAPLFVLGRSVSLRPECYAMVRLHVVVMLAML